MTNTHVYRAPVRYQVSSGAPVGIAGSNDPPIRIINLETSGTVWLSDNAGLRPGEGQPIRPGTSLLWMRPTAIYAICDPGEQCQIILTNEIEDWQPDPAAIAAAVQREQLARLIFGIMDTTVEQVDISDYSALGVTINFSAGGQSMIVELRDSLGQPIYGFQVLSGMVATAWRGTIPCYGQQLSMALNTGTATVAVYGSKREAAHRIQQDVFDRGPDASAPNFQTQSALWTEFGSTINAGTTKTIDLSPWFGTVALDIELASTAVMGTSHVQWIRNKIGVGAVLIRREALSATPAANTFQCTTSLPVVGEGIRIAIVNGTAVNFTSVEIRAAPENALGI